MVASSAVSPPPRFFLSVWFLYILTAPFYPFGQGAAQPADYFIAVFGFPALAMAALTLQGRISPVILYGALFAALTLTINLIHYAAMPDIRFLLSAVYYVFNVGILFVGILLFRSAPRAMNTATYYAVAFSLVAQMLYIIFWSQIEEGRAIGTFTNPNQLAYWALLNLAILIGLKRGQTFTFLDYGLIGLCVALQAVALSKAGLITTALMLIMLLFLPSMKKGARLIIVGIVCAGLAFIVFDESKINLHLQSVDNLSAVTERLSTLGTERDDSAEGRGYDRLLSHPYYLLFGAGEGGFKRFDGPVQELHSGLATLLFSYGITGFLLFALLLWHIFYRLPRQYVVMLGIILLFSVVHQSVRFSHFWIFLSVCYAARYLDGAHNQRGVGAAEPERVG